MCFTGLRTAGDWKERGRYGVSEFYAVALVYDTHSGWASEPHGEKFTFVK